ncbi:hypothetical protein BKA81DRAFT_233029 [Phyllosticta paracitricarpa]
MRAQVPSRRRLCLCGKSILRYGGMLDFIYAPSPSVRPSVCPSVVPLTSSSACSDSSPPAATMTLSRRALHFSLDASHVQPLDSVDALTTHFSPRRRLTCHPSFISTAVAHAIHSAAVLFFVDAGMPTAAAFHYLSLRPSAWTTFHQILTRLNFKPVADRQNSALKTRPRDIKLFNHECSMPFSFS